MKGNSLIREYSFAYAIGAIPTVGIIAILGTAIFSYNNSSEVADESMEVAKDIFVLQALYHIIFFIAGITQAAGL